MATDAPPDLSIVVPAYNEEALLEWAVRALVAGGVESGIAVEVVVVNDGSEDRTGEIAERLARAIPGVRVAHHGVNQGWGSAVRTGIANAKKEIVALSPVDSPLTGEQMRLFVEALGDADIVVGYRSDRPGYSPWLHFASQCYHRIVTGVFGLRLRDVNWIHFYRKTVIESLPLRLSGIVFPAEVLAKAVRRGYRIVEVPSTMQARTSGRPTVSRPRVIGRAVRDLGRLWWELRRPEWRRGRR